MEMMSPIKQEACLKNLFIDLECWEDRGIFVILYLCSLPSSHSFIWHPRLYDQAERLTVKADNVKANLQHAAISADIQESELQLIGADLCEHMLPRRNLLANKVELIILILSLKNILCWIVFFCFFFVLYQASEVYKVCYDYMIIKHFDLKI